ncbi:MAG: nuclear transport factor 2 family protein [Pseudomonadota bacterium]
MAASLQEIADALVAHCRAGTEREGIDTLYAPDAVSVEAMDMPDTPGRVVTGLDAIKAKHDWWDGAVEMHEAKIDGPYPHGDDRFGVIFEMKATDKASGNLMDMKEMAVYHVADGKIVREEFFYAM